MKVIGLEDKNIQYVVFRLKDKVTLSFPEDFKSSEVLICQDIDSYRKRAFEINKRQIEYKVVIFLDYIKTLEDVSGIQILKELPDSFIDYVRNKCTYKVPRIRFLKDSIVEKKIEEIENGSFFTKFVYPVISNGIKDSEKRKEIIRSIAISIQNCLQKSEPDIVKYSQYIKKKYMKLFLEWLSTNEAKKVAECLITKELKYNFDSFEINYLINNIDGD